MDFYFYLQSEELEERIWQQYLHTDMSKSFNDFKKAVGYQSIRKPKVQKTAEITKAEEVRRLEQASKFIKFNT